MEDLLVENNGKNISKNTEDKKNLMAVPGNSTTRTTSLSSLTTLEDTAGDRAVVVEEHDDDVLRCSTTTTTTTTRPTTSTATTDPISKKKRQDLRFGRGSESSGIKANNKDDDIGFATCQEEPPVEEPSESLLASLCRANGGLGGGLGGDHSNRHCHHEAEGEQEEEWNGGLPLSSSSSPSSTAAFWGAAANLCSATLGAGVLSLPHACAQAGLIGSLVLLCTAAAATVASIQLLVQACTRYQLYTYESLTEVLYGPWLRRTTEGCIVVFCQGCAVAFLIAVGDILEQANFLVWHSRLWSMVLIWLCVLLPLSLLRTMTALQMSSAVGIASIGTLVFAAIVHCIDDNKHEEQQQQHQHYYYDSYNQYQQQEQILLPEQWLMNEDNSTSTDDDNTATDHSVDWYAMLWPRKGSISLITACPIILFAFSCQVNVCAIYEELVPPPPPPPPEATTEALSSSTSNCNNPNRQQQQQQQQEQQEMLQRKQDRMFWVTWTAVLICATLYASVSLATLMDFGRLGVTPNMLNAYPTPLAGIMQVAAAGMVLAVTMAFPLNIFPARVTLDGVFPLCGAGGGGGSKIRLLCCCCCGRGSRQVGNNDEEEATGCCACSCFRERPDSRESHPNPLLTQALLDDQQPLLGEDETNDGFMPIIDAPIHTSSHNKQDPLLRTINNESKREGRSNEANDPPRHQSQGDIQFNDENEENDDDVLPFSWCRHVILTLLLAGSALGVALVAPDISIVFQIVGGTASSALGFCIPGLLGLRLGRDLVHCDGNTQGSTVICLSWLLLYGGATIGILTTALTIQQIIVGYGGNDGHDNNSSDPATKSTVGIRNGFPFFFYQSA